MMPWKSRKMLIVLAAILIVIGIVAVVSMHATEQGNTTQGSMASEDNSEQDTTTGSEGNSGQEATEGAEGTSGKDKTAEDEGTLGQNSTAEDSSEEEYSIDYLILVDSQHPLPEDWEENLRLEETTNSVGDVVRVEKRAYEAYREMEQELSDEGIHVELDSAFRSVAEQQKIIDDFTEKYGADYARTYAAVPGYSEHHTGLALDLYLIVDGVTAYENEDLMKYPDVWAKIHEKLPKYGFILRYPGNTGYPYEPWHIRYVGKDAAKEITERGISFEEYWGEQH